MLYILPILFLALSSAHEFKTIHSWRSVDFAFPNDTLRSTYLTTGNYVPENNMPLGLQVWQDKIFITVPRWKNGVVSNLNYILRNDTSTSPTLIPYPDWEANDMSAPDGLVNIFRVRVDACDRLWAIDSGIDDILGNTRVVQPVRLLAFDLKKNEMLFSYTLKDTDQKPDSFFADFVVDVEPDACNDAHAYLSDFGAYGVVVYSLAKNDSWRVSHNYFHFDPLHGDYRVNGYNFQWTDGVFGMSLSRVQKDGGKTLYFHAMSGITEFSVPTKVLMNETEALANNYYDFQVEGIKGPKTQGPSSIIDLKTGVDYFTQVNRNGIACWDTSVKLDPENFILVAQDNETMVFPNDLSLDYNSRELYVLSDNLPQLQFSVYDLTQYNFFMTVANLDKLTTQCRKS